MATKGEQASSLFFAQARCLCHREVGHGLSRLVYMAIAYDVNSIAWGSVPPRGLRPPQPLHDGSTLHRRRGAVKHGLSAWEAGSPSRGLRQRSASSRARRSGTPAPQRAEEPPTDPPRRPRQPPAACPQTGGTGGPRPPPGVPAMGCSCGRFILRGKHLQSSIPPGIFLNTGRWGDRAALRRPEIDRVKVDHGGTPKPAEARKRPARPIKRWRTG